MLKTDAMIATGEYKKQQSFQTLKSIKVIYMPEIIFFGIFKVAHHISMKMIRIRV